ncbi:MAG: hypothetical protein ABEI74_00575 [Candidatus Pacearchaeota archaeon]
MVSGESNSNEKPWIVSLSDIESNYDFFVDSLDLVGNTYRNPIVDFEGDKMNWAGIITS